MGQYTIMTSHLYDIIHSAGNIMTTIRSPSGIEISIKLCWMEQQLVKCESYDCHDKIEMLISVVVYEINEQWCQMK